MRFFALTLLLSLYLFTCKPTEEPQVVDETFDPYIDLFFQEAQARGHDLKREDFSFSMVFASIAHAAGQCRFATNEMTINPNYWNDYNEMGKQYLVFHELGHCILDRLHDNGILDHGECKSIMKGTEDGRQCARSFTSDMWRDYYLTELFEQQTPPPSWYVDELDLTVSQPLFQIEDSTTNLLRASFPQQSATDRVRIRSTFVKDEHSDTIEMTWGRFRFAAYDGNVVLFLDDQLMYYNTRWTTYRTTTLEFVQADGFYFFLVDGDMYHIDEIGENPFSSVRASFSNQNSATTRISLSIDSLD